MTATRGLVRDGSGRLLDHGGKSDVGGRLLLCRLSGVGVGTVVGPGLWRAVGLTWVGMRVKLAGGVGTEGLGYGEDAGDPGGQYDDCGGRGGMATVGRGGGHWEEDGFVGEEHGDGGGGGRRGGERTGKGEWETKNEDIDANFV